MLTRTGPLSNEKVIALLNNYFAPAYIVNADYARKGGTADPEDMREWERIRKETWSGVKAQSSTVRFSSFASASRDICMYVLTPDGHAVDALRLPEVGQTDKVLEFLQAMVKKFNVPEGKRLVATKQNAVPPRDRPADSLTLHTVTRYLDGEGKRCPCPKEFDPIGRDNWLNGMGNRIRAASQLPAENFLVFNRSEWSSLLGPANLEVGTSWSPDAALTEKLVTRFYPPSENNDLTLAHEVQQKDIKATVVSIADGVARVRLDGTVKVKHQFTRILVDNARADATLVGYMDLDLGSRKIKDLQLASKQATYLNENFAVAVHFVP
jgi:hypothetical protein